MHRNRSVNLNRFTMVPKPEIPRSTFVCEFTHKTTFDAGYLVPILVDEVLPGDHYSFSITGFGRLSTPIFPIMDNLHMDYFYFFVPYRIIWDNFVKFMGEQNSPGDPTDFLVPQQVSPATGYDVGSLQDYLGLPITPQLTASVSHSALPLRAYNLCYQEWFRDENLQNAVIVDKGDGPDVITNYVLRKRGKRKDYFTSALPFPQKGNGVPLPLGTQAVVRTSPDEFVTGTGQALRFIRDNGSPVVAGSYFGTTTNASTQVVLAEGTSATGGTFNTLAGVYPSNLYADLSSATSATINQLRQAFQIQKLLERDARGGTRYQELLISHFGVHPLDARLQRPEVMHIAHNVVNFHPVVQTSATGTYANNPMGTLSAFSTTSNTHHFNHSFSEHGVILGLVSVRADLTYQQGLARFWSRSTRYDFYWPVFACLGEQTVLNKEIYVKGDANDNLVFGYQERWAEYRYMPSRISGLFRSTATGTLDAWHLAQNFTALPTLSDQFIQESPPLDRILAVNTGPEIIFDSFFRIKKTRPMPLYSVPGLIDHF